MKRLKVVLYDEVARSVVEHDCIPDGEMQLSNNDSILVDIFLRVDELKVGSARYTITGRRYSIGGEKLILNVKPLE